MKDPLKLILKLPMLKKGDSIRAYTDNKDTTLRYNTFTLKNPASAEITMQPSGGFTWIVTK